MTLVSVIIPSYNSAHFIADAINSVINQSYTNWELIIVDDGSTDDLERVIKTYLEEDTRIKFVKKSNGGLGSARNFGIQHAEGTYILPLDADDTFEPSFIEKAVHLFSNHNDLKVVYCEAAYFGAKQGIWHLKDYTYKDLLVSNMIFATSMFKKEDYERVGGYNEIILYEDWDFWLRLLKDGGEVYRIPEVLFNYQQHHEGSLMNELHNKGKKHQSSLKHIYNKNAERFIQAYGNPIEIELNRQKMERELNHPLHVWVRKYKKSLIGRVLLKCLR